MDGHHLRVHGEWCVGVMAASIGLKRSESLAAGLLLLLVLLRLVLLLLQLLLEAGHGWTIRAAFGNAAMLEKAAVVARSVVIVALSDDFAAANNDAAMAVVQWGLGSLLEAESEIVVRLHFGC